MLDLRPGGDTISQRKGFLVALGVVWIALVWVLTVFSSAASDPNNPMELQMKYRQQSDIANFFLQLYTFGLIAAFISNQVPVLSFGPIGSHQKAFVAAIIGGVAGIIGVSMKFSISPLSIIGLLEPLKVFYVVVVSAVVEETMFRAFLPYTIYTYTKNIWLSLSIPNFLFAAFHFYVDKGDLVLFTTHFFFGVAATVLNALTGSVAGGYVYHIVNNALYV